MTKRRSFAIGCPAAFLVVCLVIYLTGGVHIIWGGSTFSLSNQDSKKTLMLSITDVAGFAPGPNDPMVQMSDTKPNPTDEQRVFRDRANTVHIEDDLEVYPSDAEALAAYGPFLDAVKAAFTGAATHSSPSIGSQADEFLGTDGGHSTVAIAFQEGGVLGAVFVGVAAGQVDAVYADSFAKAQDQKIRTGATR